MKINPITIFFITMTLASCSGKYFDTENETSSSTQSKPLLIEIFPEMNVQQVFSSNTSSHLKVTLSLKKKMSAPSSRSSKGKNNIFWEVEPWQKAKVRLRVGSGAPQYFVARMDGGIRIPLYHLIENMEDTLVDDFSVTLVAKFKAKEISQRVIIPKRNIEEIATLEHIDIPQIRATALASHALQEAKLLTNEDLARSKIIFGKAFDQYRSRKLIHALESFGKGLALDPSNQLAHFFVGEISELRKDMKQARLEYLIVLKLAPNTSYSIIAETRLEKLR